jgi:LmbE family N-acetylglucosaminyl deacetylase
LLLVPHPDDEAVGCAAAIRRVHTAGAEVFALYLTTGLPAPEVEWRWQRAQHPARIARRRQEAMRAAEHLTITPILFLPCPSRQLRWRLGETRAAIGEQIARVRADALWAPAYEGGHQDHDVANFLASGFAGPALPVIEFAEYHHAAGVRSNEFWQPNGAERVLWLAPEEQNWKRAILDLYRSERRNLGHVRVTREALRPLARYDYQRAPHPGVLFYQRFQWVPFRHPRVDFTSAEEVCAALAAASAGPASVPRAC